MAALHCPTGPLPPNKKQGHTWKWTECGRGCQVSTGTQGDWWNCRPVDKITLARGRRYSLFGTITVWEPLVQQRTSCAKKEQSWEIFPMARLKVKERHPENIWFEAENHKFSTIGGTIQKAELLKCLSMTNIHLMMNIVDFYICWITYIIFNPSIHAT